MKQTEKVKYKCFK